MFAAARDAARSTVAKTQPDDVPLLLPPTVLPASYTLDQINNELIEDGHSTSKDEEFAVVLVLVSCLHHPKRLLPGTHDTDVEAANKALRWLSQVNLPAGSIVTNDEAPDDKPNASRQRATQRARFLSQRCLEAMSIILVLETLSAVPPDQHVLLGLLAFTDSRDPWTINASYQTAQRLLETFSSEVHNSDFIVEFILGSFIRPLFSRSKPATITATGRKAMSTTAPQKGYDPADVDPANKPWKFEHIYATTVFQWAVKQATVSNEQADLSNVLKSSQKEMVSMSWPLFIPPLLTLLDDPKSEVRVRGLEILASFLPKFPARLLKQTGLGEVFEDAVMPTLLYLPNLTPVGESIMLLKPAYKVLYVLADSRFPPKEEQRDRIKSLERIMRHGVLQGYHHSSEHPQIVKILVEEIDHLAEKMQIHSLKYLKDTIPIISSVLANPFGASHPSLLLSAVKALRSTVLSCWPRISQSVHRNEIVKALVLCWGIVNEEDTSRSAEDDETLKLVKQESQVAGRVLVKAVEDELDIGDELGPLFEADPSLPKLFGIYGDLQVTLVRQ